MKPYRSVEDIFFRTVLLITILIAAALLTGCSAERKKYEADLCKSAETYVSEKYGAEYRVKSCRRLTQAIQRWLPHKSDDYMLSFTGGNETFRVWYNTEEACFLDDRQAIEINSAISSELLEPLKESLEPCIWSIEDWEFGEIEGLLLKEQGCFFHALYDGDIESFCREEKPRPYYMSASVILLSDNGDRTEYEERLNVWKTAMDSFFSVPVVTIYGERKGLYIEAYVYPAENYRPDTRTDFLAQMRIDEQSVRLYTPSWIEAADGLYVSASFQSSEIELQPGDIRFEEVYTKEEIKALLDTVPGVDGDYYTAIPVSPAYRFVFSDRLSQLVAETNDHFIARVRDEHKADNLRLRRIVFDAEDGDCCIWYVQNDQESIYENPYGDNGKLSSFYFWSERENQQ